VKVLGVCSRRELILFGFVVLSDGLKTDSVSGGSGSLIHSLTQEESEKTRNGGEKKTTKKTT